MASSVRTLGFAAFTALFALAGACSDDGGDPSGPSVDLSGTYDLSSMEIPPNVVGPPVVSGVLVMTQSRYRLNLTNGLFNPPQVIVDSGTYTVSGSNWTQNSEGNPPLPQTVGTFTVNGSILRVDATSAGQRTITVWNKR